MAETFRWTDALLLTSRFEGMPLVAIEAIWAGLAVVATAESGLANVIPKECQFAFGDVDGLEGALRWIADPGNRVAAVKHSRGKLTALLDPERYRDAIEKVLSDVDQVVSGRGSC